MDLSALQTETAVNDTLEAYIDRFGMSALVAAIVTVCDDKAAHVESNWQDGAMAKAWRRIGNSFAALATKAAGCPLP